jgi:hypothetical protein
MAYKNQGTCPIATAIFITKQAEKHGVSINKAIEGYAAEADIPVKTLEGWVWPKSTKSRAAKDKEKRKAAKATLNIQGDAPVVVTDEPAVVDANKQLKETSPEELDKMIDEAMAESPSEEADEMVDVKSPECVQAFAEIKAAITVTAEKVRTYRALVGRLTWNNGERVRVLHLLQKALLIPNLFEQKEARRQS